MNLQQLEYIVAVESHRHFAQAADFSHVTQPTLSMMIQKLEEELGVKIFERKPFSVTREGEEIISRAKRILSEVAHLREYTASLKEDISGELRLGIIPTLSPYLLPLFLIPFTEKYPQVKVIVKDLITADIILKLGLGELDIGIVATPLGEKNIGEYPIFYEEFLAYASVSEKLPAKKYIMPDKLDTDKLWLLEEGHCFRNQILNLCALKKRDFSTSNISYEAGSIETLINFVDRNDGITIVPKLATQHMKSHQLRQIREFSPPKPVREISLVASKTYARQALLAALKAEIAAHLPFESVEEKRILGI
jgi:LysR family transcriptional regulator, hydrogen peroxide-inducible genes activator